MIRPEYLGAKSKTDVLLPGIVKESKLADIVKNVTASHILQPEYEASTIATAGTNMPKPRKYCLSEAIRVICSPVLTLLAVMVESICLLMTTSVIQLPNQSTID